jgi:hypothetical protein
MTGSASSGAIYWHHVPFDTATSWHAAGFNTDSALDWIIGTSTTENNSRRLLDPISPSEAATWKNAGFTPAETKSWRSVHMTSSEAHEWKSKDFAPTEAGNWKSNGFTVPQSLAWHAAGLEADEAKEWRDRKFSPENARRWKQAGVSAQHVTDWVEKGFSLAEILDWSSFDAGSAQEWRSYGFKPQEAKKWSSAGIGAIAARGWRGAGYSLDSARRWGDAGIYFAGEAEAWKKAGFTSRDTKQWNEKRFTPEKAKELRRSCPRGMYDLFDLFRTNPYETVGSCYMVGGAQIQLLSRTVALFEMFSVPFLIDFGKRSAPGQFYKGIVKGLGAYRYVDAMGRLRTVPRLTPISPQTDTVL